VWAKQSPCGPWLAREVKCAKRTQFGGRRPHDCGLQIGDCGLKEAGWGQQARASVQNKANFQSGRTGANSGNENGLWRKIINRAFGKTKPICPCGPCGASVPARLGMSRGSDAQRRFAPGRPAKKRLTASLRTGTCAQNKANLPGRGAWAGLPRWQMGELGCPAAARGGALPIGAEVCMLWANDGPVRMKGR
jgi:hypothetical protein